MKAFPTAVGAGSETTGGRGGVICYVDTLTWNTSLVYDAATNSYSGGFYNLFYELDVPAKTILFKVSGTIVVPTYLESNFASKTNKGNVSILGQSAPGKIVFSTDYWNIINISNLIWRYCSFYRRDDVAAGADVLWISSTTGEKSENIIIDHCSFFYGGDESLSIASSSGQGEMTNITVQYCLMAAGSKGSIIGAYVGESNATTTRCAYADMSYRFPNMLGFGTSKQDAYNNIVENFTSRLIRVTGSGDFNIRNNYFQANKDNYGRNRLQYDDQNECILHSSGNIITTVKDTPTSPDFDTWSIFDSSSLPTYDPLPESIKLNTPRDLVGEPSTIYNADQLISVILPDIGNNKLLNNNGSVNTSDFVLDAFYKDLIENQVPTTVQVRYASERYPTVTELTSDNSTLNDGIPDVWRAANMNGENANDLSPSGYTWVEEFLNSVDININNMIGTFTIDLNGGDAVSADTDLYFKIYGSADNYTTPIATTGTATNDANVSVTAGVATISNIDVGAETIFKVTSIDEENNESTQSAEFDATPVDSAFSDAIYYNETTVVLNNSNNINTGISNLDSFTFAVLFDGDDMNPSGHQVVIGNENLIQVRTSGVIRARVNSSPVLTFDNGSFPDGQVTGIRIIFSYNASTGSVIVNINGTEYTTTAPIGATSAEDVIIGDSYTSNLDFYGTMYKSAIWNVFKNSIEITEIYNEL